MDNFAISKKDLLPLSSVQTAQAGSPHRALRDGAQSFESLFVLKLLQEMQKTLEGGSLFGAGMEGKTYGELIEWELAKRISAQSPLGIADALVKQLEPDSTISSETGRTIP
jgi:flagellar protein FlgJ